MNVRDYKIGSVKVKDMPGRKSMEGMCGRQGGRMLGRLRIRNMKKKINMRRGRCLFGVGISLMQ